ncbi:hypothetical protein [Amnibacterium endophyticum]|uniref:Uncharacterized protein n=1 Tax=Amnibacterium endophyticum TaxID=2109337 RepID=A0ABW4LL81_9MICO
MALSVPPLRRRRFVEEWQTDLAAARLLGLSPWSMVVAAGRVAALLLWLHVRAQVRRTPSRRELTGVGIGIGLLLVVTDIQVTVLVPFVVLVIVLWARWRIGRWIELGR